MAPEGAAAEAMLPEAKSNTALAAVTSGNSVARTGATRIRGNFIAR
jgi:hypothetical protein